MTLDELRALADEFFEWPEGSGRQAVTTFSALLFAKHVLEMHEKSLGAQNSAGMDALRNAAQRQLDALGGYRRKIGLLTGALDEQPCDSEVAARAALKQEQAEPATNEALRLAGLALIGLAEHDQHCEVFDVDDEGRHKACTCGLSNAIAVITQAGKIAPPKAEPAQKPVAWMIYTQDGRSAYVTDNPTDVVDVQRALPLYAALKQEQAEPVAWRTFDGEGGFDYRDYEGNEGYAAEWAQRNPNYAGWVEPLYTAPPQAADG